MYEKNPRNYGQRFHRRRSRHEREPLSAIAQGFVSPWTRGSCNIFHSSDDSRSEHPRLAMICYYNAARNDLYASAPSQGIGQMKLKRRVT